MDSKNTTGSPTKDMDFEGKVEGVETDYMYKGFCFGVPFPLESVKRACEFQEYRSTDIVVAGFANSGTTWTREIIWLIRNHGDTSTADNTSATIRCPALETHFVGYPNGVEIVEQMPDRRVYGALLPYSMMHPSIAEAKPKVVIIARNPKDILVSYWNYYNKVQGRYTEKFNDVFKLFKENKLHAGNPVDLIAGWWQGYPREHCFLITYEDLKTDTAASVKSIAEFLGTSLTDDAIKGIVEATTPQAMKSRNVYFKGAYDLGELGTATVGQGDKTAYIRKGVAGDWRNVLSQEQSDYVDQLCEEKWRPLGIPMKWKQ